MTEVRPWPSHYSWREEITRYNVDILWEYDTGGYSWECLALVRRPHGNTFQYAAYVDSGCSCNHAFEDGPDAYDLAWHFDKDVAVHKLFEAIRESYYLTDGEKAEAKADIFKFRGAGE